MRPSVSLRDAYKFYMPLIFMAELHMLSHAVIAAFLARMQNPEPVLAAARSGRVIHRHFNGKIEDPFIAATGDHEALRALPPGKLPDSTVLALDFGRDFSGVRVHYSGSRPEELTQNPNTTSPTPACGSSEPSPGSTPHQA